VEAISAASVVCANALSLLNPISPLRYRYVFAEASGMADDLDSMSAPSMQGNIALTF
jgi:hypothetical protein